MPPRYIDAAETAKLVRGHLRRTFPDVKFSVRTRRYAGGASVDISWTDGPTDPEVRQATRPYAGKGFDGSIDMEYHYGAWLEPDGTVVLAESSGTEGSRGSVPSYLGAPLSEDAELVSFGAGYVPTQRTVTDGFVARAMAVTERGTSGGLVCNGCQGGIPAGAPILLPTDGYGYARVVHDDAGCFRHVGTYHLSEAELSRVESEWAAVAEILEVAS